MINQLGSFEKKHEEDTAALVKRYQEIIKSY
jgi:hypothetical protein